MSGRQRAGGRQLGGRREKAADDHGDDQIAAAVAGWAEQAIEAEARSMPSTAATWPCGSARLMVKASWPGGMTVPPLSRVRRPSTSSGGQSVRLSSVRFLTLPAVAIGLAQEDGGRRGAVRDGLDVHGRIIPAICRESKARNEDYMATKHRRRIDFCRNISSLAFHEVGSSG